MLEVKYCPQCHRPKATSQDWDSIPEGEGGHLCWSFEDSCNRDSIDVKPLLLEMITSCLSGVSKTGSRSHSSHDILETSAELTDLIYKRFLGEE